MATKRRAGQRPTAEQRKTAQEVFLATFRQCANLTDACRVANIARATAYLWLANDAPFKLAFDDAQADANDTIRREIWHRAIEGDEEPVIAQGRIARQDDGTILTIRKKSDALLKFLAASRMPEFRERVDVTSNGTTLESLHDAIAQAVTDPAVTDLACDLLQHFASVGNDSGGAGVDSE